MNNSLETLKIFICIFKNDLWALVIKKDSKIIKRVRNNDSYFYNSKKVQE